MRREEGSEQYSCLRCCSARSARSSPADLRNAASDWADIVLQPQYLVVLLFNGSFRTGEAQLLRLRWLADSGVFSL